MVPTWLTDYIFLNLEDVSKGYWRSKVSKKGVKQSQIEFKIPGICQKKYYILLMTLMNSIFVTFQLIYKCVIFYINWALITNKCQKWIKRAKNEEKNALSLGAAAVCSFALSLGAEAICSYRIIFKISPRWRLYDKNENLIYI